MPTLPITKPLSYAHSCAHKASDQIRTIVITKHEGRTLSTDGEYFIMERPGGRHTLAVDCTDDKRLAAHWRTFSGQRTVSHLRNKERKNCDLHVVVHPDGSETTRVTKHRFTAAVVYSYRGENGETVHGVTNFARNVGAARRTLGSARNQIANRINYLQTGSVRRLTGRGHALPADATVEVVALDPVLLMAVRS